MSPINAITNALRRMADPEAIAGYLLSIVADDKASHRDRLAAAQLILDRCEGKAVQTLSMSVQTAPPAELPPDFDQLPRAQRERLLDAIEVRALPTGKP